MIRSGLIFVFAGLAIFLSGCRSPMEGYLSRCPNWDRAAQHMAAERQSESAGLAWAPFPDLRNPLHIQIWKALWDKDRIGDGLGCICNYYGVYLVTVSAGGDHGRLSSFYDPRHQRTLEATEGLGFNLYRGDRKASVGSIRRLVEHLLAVNSYGGFIVDGCDQIPHDRFEKDNPNLPFPDFLAAKGITIRPPSILSKNEEADYSRYSECSVFAYRRLGGQILRYEVRCEKGKITTVEEFKLAADVGDCWGIM